jgi:hypothetical protein
VSAALDIVNSTKGALLRVADTMALVSSGALILRRITLFGDSNSL